LSARSTGSPTKGDRDAEVEEGGLDIAGALVVDWEASATSPCPEDVVAGICRPARGRVDRALARLGQILLGDLASRG